MPGAVGSRQADEDVVGATGTVEVGSGVGLALKGVDRLPSPVTSGVLEDDARHEHGRALSEHDSGFRRSGAGRRHRLARTEARDVVERAIASWNRDRSRSGRVVLVPSMSLLPTPYSQVVPIVPEAKDWTWVLERPCPECWFDSSTLPRERIAPLIRSNAQGWLPVLAEPPALLRRRRRDDRWSPLEYACHVRDVFRLYDERLQLMLTLQNPTYPNWDQDRSADEDRYNEQDPTAVASELVAAAAELSARFDTVEGAGWNRLGSRSDGANFTVDTFGRYMIHDPIHHLHDVTVDLAALGS